MKIIAVARQRPSALLRNLCRAVHVLDGIDAQQLKPNLSGLMRCVSLSLTWSLFMYTRCLNLFVAAATPILLVLFCSGPLGFAKDVSPAATKTVYTLCGGFCSRSMAIVATFDDVQAACEAATKLRQTNQYVGILTGNRVDPMLVHPAFSSELKSNSFSIVRQSLRCGTWFTETNPENVENPEATIVELRKSSRIAELIYHLPNGEGIME